MSWERVLKKGIGSKKWIEAVKSELNAKHTGHGVFEFDYKNSHLGHVDLELISFRAYEDDDKYNYYLSYQLTGSGLLEYATLVREAKTLKTDNS